MASIPVFASLISAPVRWEKVTLIGVGLLGGSLGMALKQRRLAGRVTGFVRRKASIRECVAHGAVDDATLDLHEAVSGADLIVFCTPLAQMRDVMERALPAIGEGAIITDVGSVKVPVVKDLERLARRAGAEFIGSHPMAGGEKMGVQAARADLFQGAVCVVTPTAKSSKPALRKVEALWRDVGAKTLRLTAKHHDELVARSSHLPHLLAATLAGHVLNPKHGREQGLLCAGGFRDTTRIARSSPEMWRDIVLMNQKNLLKELKTYIEELKRFQRNLSCGDSKRIEKFFSKARRSRDSWHQNGQDS